METHKKILLSLFIGFSSYPLWAQKEENKIHIEISRDVNGEKRTFKGDYESMEQMKADPNYKEFAGEEDDHHFFGRGNGFSFHFDNMMDEDKSFFKIFEDEGVGNSFFFHRMLEDSSDLIFDFDKDATNIDELKERMKQLGVELEHLRNHQGNDDSFSARIYKKIKISEVDNEFGKRGKVEGRDKLELNDLSFYPNPSSDGRFKITFTTTGEGELEIRVSNLEGREVFNRYFESFSGSYAETIDLSTQKEGIYLLEIIQDGKKVTKKIVIN